MGEIPPDENRQFHVFVALVALVLAACLAFLAATPEPCMDGRTTACAATGGEHQ